MIQTAFGMFVLFGRRSAVCAAVAAFEPPTQGFFCRQRDRFFNLINELKDLKQSVLRSVPKFYVILVNLAKK